MQASNKVQGLPGPQRTYLFRVPNVISFIEVLKKGRLFGAKVGSRV